MGWFMVLYQLQSLFTVMWDMVMITGKGMTGKYDGIFQVAIQTFTCRC